MCRLSWSNSSHLVAIQFWNVRSIQILQKFTKNHFWEGSRSFKVIDVDKFKKPVTSACYDKQHVCASATVFTLHDIIAVK